MTVFLKVTSDLSVDASNVSLEINNVSHCTIKTLCSARESGGDRPAADLSSV